MSSSFLSRQGAVGLATLSAVTASLTLAATHEAKSPQHPPALNHVYVVLDAPTYAAIRDSSELSELLGRADGGLPDYAPPAPDADRLFFRGRKTYLEFFAPDNRFDEPVGKAGLALGHDDPSRFDALERDWRVFCGEKARRTSVSFRRVEPAVPWYDALQCDDTAAGPTLSVWAMVYRPEFYRWQSGADVDASPRTGRADVLAPRRAAGQGRFDINGVTVGVAEPVHSRLAAQLEQAGFAREDRSDATVLRGDGFTLALRRAEASTGLVAISLQTERPPTKRLSLGTALADRSADGAVILRFGASAGN
jgi:hypothetical protein